MRWLVLAALVYGCDSPCRVSCEDSASQIVEGAREIFRNHLSTEIRCDVEGSALDPCTTICERAKLEGREILDAITCWPESLDDRPAACSIGPRSPIVFVETSTVMSSYGPITKEYAGGAEVSEVGPLQFTLDDGSAITVRLADLPSHPFGRGERVQLELASFCYFGCYQSIVIRDALGVLVLAGWHGSAPSLPEMPLSYVASDCATSVVSCGIALGLRLRAGNVEVDPGHDASAGGYLVVNGASSAYAYLHCTDTPQWIHRGAVVRL